MGDYMDTSELTPSLNSNKAAVSTNLLQHASRLGAENSMKLQILMQKRGKTPVNLNQSTNFGQSDFLGSSIGKNSLVFNNSGG
jgi:hypothetical protein